MFSKVLIANRGTIRAKCVQAVRELGARAAVFYTDQDNMSHGVRMADEAYHLAGADPIRAYYDAERIADLAVQIGADAVHPGYGFLAENVEFVRNLAARKIRFIGPDERMLRLTVDKLRMKEEAEKTGMKIVPGSGACLDLTSLVSAAKETGFPVLLKPVSGSGGVGISVIRKEAELRPAYEAFVNRSERLKLENRQVFVEKYQEHARYIEFPVLRDKNGNAVSLPEIEASIQRRFQKVVVETPSPLKDRDLIRELSAQSRRFLERLEYAGLASVEFIVTGKNICFIEMNTYVPVWHAASTYSTDADLVREQIRIISGDLLSVREGEQNPRGHVIGVSINAEDPAKDFVPSPGTLTQFEVPLATNATINATAKRGDTISSFYEPVIAQALAIDSTREASITKLKVALSELIVEGVKTNLPLVRAILESPQFTRAEADISMLVDKDSLAELLEKTRREAEEDMAAIIAALTLHGDANSQEIIDAAGRVEGFSFWNLTSRLLNRSTME